MNLPIDPRIKHANYENKCSKKFKSKFDQGQGKKYEFISTQFILDEHYVGKLPKVQVGIVNLNDNIDENFLRKEISRSAQIRTLEIVREPRTKRHLGLAKVVFANEKLAKQYIKEWANDAKTLMGQKPEVFLDPRFQRIEHERTQLLNPAPKIRTLPTQPKLPNPVPIVHPITQLPFSPAQLPPPIKPEIRLDRLPHANLSLDDRLAKLGLKQTSAYPPLPDQTYPMHERTIAQQQYHHHNHSVLRPEKKPDVPSSPSYNFVVEDERDWNPDPVKEEKIEEPIEKINLTSNQIDSEVLPHCFEKFVNELEKNLLTTLQRRLIQTHGYPLINEAQERHKQVLQQKKLEELREKHEQQRLAALAKYNNERKFIGQKPIYVPKPAEPIRFKRDNGAGRANFINRSAAKLSQGHHQQTRGSSCDTSSRHSRDPSPEGSVISTSSSSSRTSTSSSSSSLSSSSGSSSSSSLSTSRSSASQSSKTSNSSSIEYKNQALLPSRPQPSENIPAPTEEKAKAEAAQVLLQLNPSQNHGANRVPTIKVEPIVKKRKRKTLDVAQNSIQKKKQKTDKEDKPDSPKPVKFCARGKEEIKRLYSTFDLEVVDSEDRMFIDTYHNKYVEGENLENIDIIDNSNAAAINAHLLAKNNDIKSEIDSGRHPKWWRGCSRCNIIEISDKGKIEEAVDDDLQKASIKSHVIQAANSTRRDLRNDQRRIAALNPEIDPSLLKQFTSNTLQMRAKNLRFSRSKIHKWGLFACEKIANGDAVIEYVGEKIRPSLADHREKIVYTNLPTHDGSSYFFRVDYDVIDATLKGNKARFINHSCNPNCIAKVIKHDNGTNSIVIYAKQAIDVDEEITYDYKFPREEDEETKILCRCKATNCQKYLN